MGCFRKAKIWLALAFCVAVVVAGCRTEPVAFSTEPDLPKTAETQPPASPVVLQPGDHYEKPLIQAGDTLTLSSPDSATPYQFRVQNDGSVIIPPLGEFIAVGKTIKELWQEIVRKDSRYRRYSLAFCGCETTYYVMGEVRSPGLRPYDGVITLSKTIQAAGGFTEAANTKRIKLVRAKGSRLTVRYRKDATDDVHNPQVFPGDTVMVERVR